jgi:hypothetical protein
MVHHVPVLSGLQIFQGTLECLMGLLLLVMTLAVPSMMPDLERMLGHGANAPSPTFLILLYGLLGLALVAVGALRIVAGVMAFRYRGRILGMISLAAGLGTLISCYCFPTALGLFIYGLIVYLNADVARAFQMRAQGASVEDVRRGVR